MKKLLILLLALVLGAGGAVWTDSRLSKLSDRVDAAWVETDEAMARRAAVVPRVIALVNRYTSREQALVRAAEQAQKALEEADTPAARMSASDSLSSALGRLLMAADQYRTLKTNPAYRQCQTDLMAAENELTISRRDYNNAAQVYNVALRAFPGSLYGEFLGYEEAPYFKPGSQRLS